jgi:hypothetical protein
MVAGLVIALGIISTAIGLVSALTKLWSMKARAP